MPQDRDYPQGVALALIAYALDIGGDNALAPVAIDALADAVCADATQRTRLISAIAASQDREMALQILEILGRRQGRLRDALEVEMDNDEIIGVWSQRIAGGAILAGIGFVATGIATGGWGFLMIVGPLVAGGIATAGRASMRTRAREIRRALEDVERLIELIQDASRT